MAGMGAMTTMNISELKAYIGDTFAKTERMPALFIGHGNPMNAIEDNHYRQGWQDIAKTLPRPKAILCISAHWETPGTFVTAMDKPRTIHDFYGFPQELFDVRYEAPGSKEVAEMTKKTIKKTDVGFDEKWGLDHGTWSVLLPMFPKADIPVLQLSLDFNEKPAYHFDLAVQLRELRNRGILIIGSGNIVHNLRMARPGANYDWAQEFDETVEKKINDRDFASLVAYEKLGQPAMLSIPTNEHYLPMLYTLGLAQKGEDIRFFNEGIDMGAASMRSFVVA
jgi:4,5-DOPA dioxygenase extradiol